MTETGDMGCCGRVFMAPWPSAAVPGESRIIVRRFSVLMLELLSLLFSKGTVLTFLRRSGVEFAELKVDAMDGENFVGL